KRIYFSGRPELGVLLVGHVIAEGRSGAQPVERSPVCGEAAGEPPDALTVPLRKNLRRDQVPAPVDVLGVSTSVAASDHRIEGVVVLQQMQLTAEVAERELQIGVGRDLGAGIGSKAELVQGVGPDLLL